MRIAIIGAGWFGCHIATSLLRDGHDITVFERNSDIFLGASGNNQNRLHLGFHYPRSWQTRAEIINNHDRFLSEYPTREIENNFFAISTESSIDFDSYIAIMESQGILNEDVAKYLHAPKYGIQNVERGIVIKTKERLINTESAKRRFLYELKNKIQFEVKVKVCGNPQMGIIQHGSWLENHEVFDAVVDCTGGELDPNEKIFFEPAVMAEYEGPQEHFALTVMDGPFPCLYPTCEPGIWRVSHVAHTARGCFDTYAKAERVLQNLNVEQITNDMSEAMSHYYPDFLKIFKPKYSLIKAVRTKLKNNNASRECYIREDGRVCRVYSGKICSVFIAESRVKKWLQTL